MEVSHSTGDDRTRLQQLARQDWFPDYNSQDELALDPWEIWIEEGVLWCGSPESMLVYQDLGSVRGSRLLKIHHTLGESEACKSFLLDTMASVLDRCHEKVLLVDIDVDEDAYMMTRRGTVSLTPVRGWPGGHLCTVQKEPTFSGPHEFRTLVRIQVGDLQWEEAQVDIRLDGTHLEIELPIRAYAVRNDAPMGCFFRVQWRGWPLQGTSDVRTHELARVCDRDSDPWSCLGPTGEELYDRYYYTYIGEERRGRTCVCHPRIGRLPMRGSGSSGVRAELERMRHAWGFIYARACSAARVIQRHWRRCIFDPQFELARTRLMREYEAML